MVEDLGSASQGFTEALETDRHHHEFLDVDRIVGVFATVDDVHHRRRQPVGPGAAEIPEQRLVAAAGRGVGCGQRAGQHRVGTEIRLVLGAVQLEHPAIDFGLVGHVEINQHVDDAIVDVVDGLADTLSEIAILCVGVSEFVGFVLSGAGATGHRCSSHDAFLGRDVHFDGRIAPAVENFSGADFCDGCAHRLLFPGRLSLVASAVPL